MINFKNKQHRALIIRFTIFCALFIVLTGLLGPWIVSSRLLYGFQFYLYANLGKMVIYSSIVFFLLARAKLNQVKLPKYDKKYLVFILMLSLALPVFLFLANLLLKQSAPSDNLLIYTTTHLALIISPVLILLGVFGLPFLLTFARKFKKELAFCFTLSIIYDFIIFRVWTLWPYFSNLVLTAEKFLFSLNFKRVLVIPPRTLYVENFGVSIAQACSGLDSLFLFSSLYLLIALLEWRNFNKIKLIFMFLPVSIGLILVNILRVYLLILIGVLISPQLSLQLFHTYAGMLLFIIYFFLFWKIFYKWMRMNN